MSDFLASFLPNLLKTGIRFIKKLKNSKTSRFSHFHCRFKSLAKKCHLILAEQEKFTNNIIWQPDGFFIIYLRILSSMLRFADRLFIKTNVYCNIITLFFSFFVKTCRWGGLDIELGALAHLKFSSIFYRQSGFWL